MNRKKRSNYQSNNLKVVTGDQAGPEMALKKDANDYEDLKVIAEAMDKDYMLVGKAVAGLYRTMCENAVTLPEMNLTTDLLTIINNESGLSVMFHRDRIEKPGKTTDSSYHHDDYEEDSYDPYDDEEEGLLYDGD